MVGKSSKSSKIAAFILIAVNLIAMILSALIGALGIWMISSPHTLTNAVHKTGNLTLKVLLSQETLSVRMGIGLVAVSAFMIFISYMGFYGAISRSTFLLFMYSTLTMLLLLLECALVFYFATSVVEKGLQEQDGLWTHALRLAFKCCEFNHTTLHHNEISIPWSCCGPEGHADYSNCDTTQMYADDCHRSISTWLDKYQTGIYATLAVVHVVLASCSLVRRRTSPSHSYS